MLDIATLQTLQVNRSAYVEGTGQHLCDLDPLGQRMYFLVNVSPPKPLDIATSGS